jgi:hypothetical protein
MTAFANLRLRFAAFLLDYLVIAAYIILLILVSVLPKRGVRPWALALGM